ncbi:MAG: serine protease [Thermoplasmata archaeon]|jgi:subtilisin family serine protease|nr:serine protease [Thermoplasmata archaeon]
MRTTVVLTLALALAPALAPAAEAGLLGGLLPAPTPGTLLVGAQPGLLGGATSLVVSLGGVVTGSSPEIGVVRADFADLNAALAALKLSSLVAFAEKDGAASEAGAQWNGAEWNSAEWNGAQWNGAQWNGAAAADPGVVIQWGLVVADVPRAWSISAGSLAAPICVLDSGVDLAHPDLAANLWTGSDGSHGVNLVQPGSPPQDDAGHGTHVAGIAAAVVGNGVGVAGVGNEPIMTVKALDGTGHGRESDVAFGLVWCATHGAKVALMSLSADGTRTLKQALAFASDHDVLLVASAGNQGPCASCVGFPASDPHVLAVGAIGKSLAPASFSSSGPQVALLAPGVDVASTFLGGTYAYGTGTSMAAAWVAGAAALVRDAHPSASAQATRSDLTGHSAAGVLDVRAALAASL